MKYLIEKMLAATICQSQITQMTEDVRNILTSSLTLPKCNVENKRIYFKLNSTYSGDIFEHNLHSLGSDIPERIHGNVEAVYKHDGVAYIVVNRSLASDNKDYNEDCLIIARA